MAGSALLTERIADLSRDRLLGIAVARGCRHYAPLLAPGAIPTNKPELPHEVLGVALLLGPQDAATFQAIRCGAMVLSDLGNSPQRIWEASEQFGVTPRVAHIARCGFFSDDQPQFWQALLSLFPPILGEEDFLPGVSRLTSETRVVGPGKFPIRTWLRTQYRR